MSQGYDGPSVMSEKCSGVQQLITAVVPMAVYVNCYAHCLNLVLVDSTMSLCPPVRYIQFTPTNSQFYNFMPCTPITASFRYMLGM